MEVQWSMMYGFFSWLSFILSPDLHPPELDWLQLVLRYLLSAPENLYGYANKYFNDWLEEFVAWCQSAHNTLAENRLANTTKSSLKPTYPL